MQTLKVEIWSDVMCPFCYIGKRRLEQALDQFEHANRVQITWKSFQLNPAMETNPDKTIHEYLSEDKGVSLNEARQMNSYVTDMASKVGLLYDLDHAVVANSFDAHRFTHFAKARGKQLEAEEVLFKAYFTQGKNTADHSVLMDLGTSIGLDRAELKSVLESDQFAADVRSDVAEAQQIGVRGVPFFVFDRKYAVSGAQEIKVFLDTLECTWNEEKC